MIKKRYIIHILASLFVLLLAGLGITVAIIFAKLAAQPMNLMPYLPKAQSFLAKRGYNLTLDSAWLSFDGSLNIDAKGIKLEPIQYPLEALTAKEAELDIAPAQLLLARIAFSKVVLKEPQMPVTMSKSAIRLLGQTMAFKRGEQPTDFIDIVEVLNSGGKWGYFYKALDHAAMVDGLVRIDSQLLPGEKTLQNLQLAFNRNWGTGETLTFEGLLNAAGSSVPIYVSADHESGADTMSMRARVEGASTTLVEPFLPEVVKDRASFTITTAFKGELGLGNKLITPILGISAREITINLPEAYDWPLKYTNLSALFGYSDEKEGTFIIKYLKATDAFGTTAVAKGDISHVFAKPKFNITAKVATGVKETVLQYIPHGKAHDWVAENVVAAKLKNASVGFYGTIVDHRLDGEEGRAYFDISGDIYDAEVKTHDGLPNATKVNARYEWQKGAMRILAHEGALGGQKAKDVSVEVTRMFDDGPTMIRIIGTATGSSQQALDYASTVLNFKIPLQVKGQHISALSLIFPAIKGLKLEDTTFKSSSDFLDMETDLPLGFGHLVSSNAVLDITQNSLEFNASGFLKDQPITMFWWENLQALFKQTKVELNGQVDAGVLQEHLPLKGTISGILGTAFTLEQTGDDIYKYTLAGDLVDTNLNLPELGWIKTAGETAKLSALGSVKNKGNIFIADALSLQGKDLDVQGRAELNITQFSQSKLDFTSLKLGQTDAMVKYQPNLLEIKGKSIYLGGLKFSDEETATKPVTPKKETKFFQNGTVNIDVGKVILPENEITGLKANFKRSGGWWNSGSLSAKLTDKDTLTLKVQPAKNGVEANVKASNVAEVMKLLQVKDSFRGGTLDGSVIFTKDAKTAKAIGKGQINIRDIRVLNAPVLLNILQILSLEALTSPGEGMLFEKITIPVTYDGNIHIKDAKIKGPSLGFKLNSGDINLSDKTLHIKGTVIPVRGINQAIAKIPLIGPLLTGSQEALIAADFTVKGKFSDPKVSMNPLSFITPGIIKDIFR